MGSDTYPELLLGFHPWIFFYESNLKVKFTMTTALTEKRGLRPAAVRAGRALPRGSPLLDAGRARRTAAASLLWTRVPGRPRCQRGPGWVLLLTPSWMVRDLHS